MNVEEARSVLGVAPGADPTEIRRSFRRLVRRHHPDVAGSGGGTMTAQIVTAYRTLLVDAGRHAPVPRPPSPPARGVGADVKVEGEIILVGLPPGEAWRALLEISHGLGEPAYVDGRAGLLEIIVEFLEYPVCSVVLSLQWRKSGWTAAECFVEALSGDPAPPADAVARLVADRLRAHLAA